jgi:hypothetical protein
VHDRLPVAVHDNVPQQILTFHALELALKAFLAHHRYTPKQLWDRNRFGHNLVKLHSAAKKHGKNLFKKL